MVSVVRVSTVEDEVPRERVERRVGREDRGAVGTEGRFLLDVVERRFRGATGSSPVVVSSPRAASRALLRAMFRSRNLS